MNGGQASAPPPSSAYQATLSWLYRTQRFGIKLGLENIERLLRELKLPGGTERIIHVAGTNGKGSVCAMIDSIARAQGYRTGLFTSPHLVSYRERVRVNGEMISDGEVAAGLTKIRELTRDWDPHPTFFEITTALALLHFKMSRCDIVVLETGLGGRLDATNALTPVVSVITPIGYDHQSLLGDTLEKIAGEKAGIIKGRVPVVSAAQEPEAERVIRARAAECEAPLEIVNAPYKETPLALAGEHQSANAAVAIAALRLGKISIEQSSIARGLAEVHWPARFQAWDAQIIIDGAHNPASAAVLAKTWHAEFGGERAAIILGVLSDKDIAGVWRELAPIAGELILPVARGERALAPAELEKVARQISPDLPMTMPSSFSAAIETARARRTRILITGSLHFAGEALATLGGDPSALEECAQ